MTSHATNILRALSETRLFSAADRASIPIEECNEPLVDIEEACPAVRVRLRVPARLEYIGAHSLFVRKSVSLMLSQVALALPKNLFLSVFDAYRPLEYQAWRHNMVREQLSQQFAGLSADELSERADKLVARPDSRPSHAPPHSTGGAVDMLLEDEVGKALDFGSQPSVFTPAQNELHPTFSEVGAEAAANRRLLLTLASGAGFVNFVGEWWHFSFGDQEWALYTQTDSARYGRADLIHE